MRKQRPYPLTLELLDGRIVPSGVAMAPIHHAALVEHLAIRAAAHVTKVHEPVHPKGVHHARVHHVDHSVHHARVHHVGHSRIIRAVQNSGGSASSSSTVVTGSMSGAAVASPVTATSPRTAVSATGTGPAQVPTVATSPIAAPSVPVPNPAATSNPADIKNGPLANTGQELITIYAEFVQQGGGATFISSEAGVVRIEGTSVGVDVHSTGGNFGSLVSAMTGLGMRVQAKDATLGVIEGLLPIGQLVAAARNSQTLSLSPIFISIPRMPR